MLSSPSTLYLLWWVFRATAAWMHEDRDGGNVFGVNGRAPCRDGLGRSMVSRQ